MNTSLAHLPEETQNDLAEIALAIRELLQPEMIILFGSYARGNWVYDIYTDEYGFRTSYISDYDILVVIADKGSYSKAEGKLRSKLNASGRYAVSIEPIVHGIGYLNNQLEEGHFFFADIVKEGIMLYDSGKCRLAEAKQLSPAERGDIAETHFKRWFNTANDFIRHYHYAIKDASYNLAAFLLHQATERYLAAILLTFTNYKPRLHDLEKLYRMACTADTRFTTIFPMDTPRAKALFIKLKEAYIDARYEPDYTISAEDLQYLGSRVQQLQQMAEAICTEQIRKYRGDE